MISFASLLADYIVQNHCQHLRLAIPEIEPLVEKGLRRAWGRQYELLNIRQDFIDLVEELLNHMNKEEMALSPAIKSGGTWTSASRQSQRADLHDGTQTCHCR